MPSKFMGLLFGSGDPSLLGNCGGSLELIVSSAGLVLDCRGMAAAVYVDEVHAGGLLASAQAARGVGPAGQGRTQLRSQVRMRCGLLVRRMCISICLANNQGTTDTQLRMRLCGWQAIVCGWRGQRKRTLRRSSSAWVGSLSQPVWWAQAGFGWRQWMSQACEQGQQEFPKRVCRRVRVPWERIARLQASREVGG